MKKLFVNLFSLTLIIIFLTSVQSFTQNINDALRLGYSGLGANARALGMGNSYIGQVMMARLHFSIQLGLGC